LPLLLGWAGIFLFAGKAPGAFQASPLVQTASLALEEAQLYDFLTLNRITPPLSYQAQALFKAAGAEQWLFPACGLLLTFLLFMAGRKIAGPLTGFLLPALFLAGAGFFPQTLALLPGLVFPVAGLLCLLYSENFLKPGYSLGFGVCLGLGLLTGSPAAWLLGIFGFYRAYRALRGYFAACPGVYLMLTAWVLYWGVFLGLLYRNPELRIPGPESFALTVILLFMAGLLFWGLSLLWFLRAEKTGAARSENRAPWLHCWISLFLAYLLCSWFFLNPGLVPVSASSHYYSSAWGPLLGKKMLSKEVDALTTGMNAEMQRDFIAKLEGGSGSALFFTPLTVDPQLVKYRLRPESRPDLRRYGYLIYLGAPGESVSQQLAQTGASGGKQHTLERVYTLEVNPGFGLVLFRLVRPEGISSPRSEK